MENLFTTQPLRAELCRMGIGPCGTCREQFRGFPKELKIRMNTKLPYHYRSRAVNAGVATLRCMGCLLVTMKSKIHPLSGEDFLVLIMRQHLGDTSPNARVGNSTFLPGERRKELDIPAIVDAYNQHKVGVDVVDQYRTCCDAQLISRPKWYGLLKRIPETARINSLEINRNLLTNKERILDHYHFCFSIVHNL